MGCFQSKTTEKGQVDGPPQLTPIGQADAAQKGEESLTDNGAPGVKESSFNKNSNTTSVNQDDSIDQLLGSRYGSKVANLPMELRDELQLSGIEANNEKKQNVFILGEKASMVGGTSNISSDPELKLSKIDSAFSADSHRSYRASTIPSGISSTDSQISLRASNISAITSGFNSSSSIDGNRIKSDNFDSQISCKFTIILTLNIHQLLFSINQRVLN